MKHKRTGRTLGRQREHRHQMLRNLAASLLEHGSVTTTEAKGKELRRFVEPIITKARRESTLRTHRALLAALGNRQAVIHLQTVAKANSNRSSGYTRLTKLPIQRSDGAREVKVDIIDT